MILPWPLVMVISASGLWLVALDGLYTMKSHEIPLYKSQFCVFSDAIHRVGKDHHLPQEVIFANWPIPCCLAKQHGTVRHYCHLLPFEGNIYIYRDRFCSMLRINEKEFSCFQAGVYI